MMAQDLPNLYAYGVFFFTLISAYGLWNLVQHKPKNHYNSLKQLPGPPRNIFGQNLGQFDPRSPFLKFQEWAQQYGPIFQVKVGFQHIISVNDPRIAKELFEKRGSKYSSRQSPYVGYELLSEGRRIGFAPSGPMHTAFRRQIHGILSISKKKENIKIQEMESRQVLRDFMDFSESAAADKISRYVDAQSIFRRYTLSVMMTLAFGHRVESLEDEIVKTVWEIGEEVGRAIQPGQYLVDIFPILKKLPYFLRTWEHEANRKVKYQWEFLHDLLVRTENQMDKGMPNPGLIRALVEQRQGMSAEERDDKFLDDRSIAYQAMTLMEAGSDTTATTMMNFTLAMVLNPRVMRKGQDAVDIQVPGSRLPTFDDIPDIPYVNQIAKEVMRWRPVVVMGIPHSNTQDDELDGYYIPKDSLIFGNMWAIQHNPQYYPDPEEFSPERFDGDRKSAFESSMEADPMDRDHYIFGWGRRICPGIHLAEASVLLLITRLLWAFDIIPAKNEEGNDISVSADPATAYVSSIVTHPKSFPVQFRLRSEERGKLIQESYAEALGVWAGKDLDIFRE